MGGGSARPGGVGVVVRKPPKPAPPREGHDRAGEGVAREGKEVYWWLRLMPPRGFQVLPRRWVEHLLLVEPEQEGEQGLRASVRQRGSVRLCGDDPPDGERIGRRLKNSRQFPEG